MGIFEGTKRICAAVCLLAACIAIVLLARLRATDAPGFFIWQEGYIACGQGDRVVLPFTYYYTGTDRTLEDVDAVSFPDGAVAVESFQISQMELGQGVPYRAFLLTLTLRPAERGSFTERALAIRYQDGSTKNLPIGSQAFDVGQPEDGRRLVDVYRGPAASTDSMGFVYDYAVSDPSAKLTALKVWPDISLQSAAGLPLAGAVALEGGAPVKYIQAKLAVSCNGVQYPYYGKGYWCGALSLDADGIRRSRDYAAQHAGGE